MNASFCGILPVDKPPGKTSFSLVGVLRKQLKVKKIGHAGTLDPFATGVMVLLIGRSFTRLSDTFLQADKEYQATLTLGVSTDSYDCDGKITNQSSTKPTLEEIQEALTQFQGEISQIPPMYSAKKINGVKLYTLARQGKTLERKPVLVTVDCTLISYNYPYLKLNVSCSKGTYIRSIANDLGSLLQCGAHLSELTRTRSGQFTLDGCFPGTELFSENLNLDRLRSFLIQDTESEEMHVPLS